MTELKGDGPVYVGPEFVIDCSNATLSAAHGHCIAIMVVSIVVPILAFIWFLVAVWNWYHKRIKMCGYMLFAAFVTMLGMAALAFY